MPASPSERECVECRTSEGHLLATVEIFAPLNDRPLFTEDHPLVSFSPVEARHNNEEPLQLRERGRYEYRLRAVNPCDDLVLLKAQGISPSRVESAGEDRGLIEPQDHCG